MRTFVRALVGLVTLLLASEAGATNYTLWIHGRSSAGSTQPGNYTDFRYWGPASTPAGVNKVAVNWDGTQTIASQNGRIRDALDCYCTGSNWCYIAVHSAGDLQIGYALSLYGGSARLKKNATPNSAGVCGNTDGTTQVGWNIKWVSVASGAGGGSELSDIGSWSTSEPLVSDLKTVTSRAMYNHNETRGKYFYMFAGASGTLYSAALPGQDDEAVAYHTTGGVSGSSGAAYGNPSDWFSSDLNMGTAACEDGKAKWNMHSLSFRDDGESYNHFSSQGCAGGAPCWAGIIGRVVADAVANAK